MSKTASFVLRGKGKSVGEFHFAVEIHSAHFCSEPERGKHLQSRHFRRSQKWVSTNEKQKKPDTISGIRLECCGISGRGGFGNDFNVRRDAMFHGFGVTLVKGVARFLAQAVFSPSGIDLVNKAAQVVRLVLGLVARRFQRRNQVLRGELRRHGNGVVTVRFGLAFLTFADLGQFLGRVARLGKGVDGVEHVVTAFPIFAVFFLRRFDDGIGLFQPIHRCGVENILGQQRFPVLVEREHQSVEQGGQRFHTRRTGTAGVLLKVFLERRVGGDGPRVDLFLIAPFHGRHDFRGELESFRELVFGGFNGLADLDGQSGLLEQVGWREFGQLRKRECGFDFLHVSFLAYCGANRAAKSA